MTEPRYFSLGQLAGGEMGVLHTLPGQDILIQDSEVGRRLAMLLDPEATAMIQRGRTRFLRVPHNRDVDVLLVELIDLFISIRYAHPSLVQLELTLPTLSEAEAADGTAMLLEPTEP